MPIEITCPDCAHEYKFHEKHVGKKTRCKSCSAVFSIEIVEPPREELSEAELQHQRTQRALLITLVVLIGVLILCVAALSALGFPLFRGQLGKMAIIALGVFVLGSIAVIGYWITKSIPAKTKVVVQSPTETKPPPIEELLQQCPSATCSRCQKAVVRVGSIAMAMMRDNEFMRMLNSPPVSDQIAFGCMDCGQAYCGRCTSRSREGQRTCPRCGRILITTS